MEEISSEYEASSCSAVRPLMVVIMILISDRKEEVGLEVGVEDSKQFNNEGLVQSQASTVVEICL